MTLARLAPAGNKLFLAPASIRNLWQIVRGFLFSSRAGAGSAAAASPLDAVQRVIPEPSWEEHEKARISEALKRTNWNITRAAQLLGMTFRTLQYRVEKYSIKRP